MVWPLDHPLILLPIFLTAALLLIRRKISAANRLLPPGPPGWPVFGNMFQLGLMPHRTLTQLRHKYGPVIWLRIGAINTVAILSAKTAYELFKNHDLAFAGRTVTATMRVHNYDKASLALAPYGPYWRLMRRLFTVDLLTAKRMNDTAPIRRKCVDDMVDWIAKEASKLEKGRGLHVARFVFLMTFNLFGNLTLSRDLFDPEPEKRSEFFTAIMRMKEWTGEGHANVADLFPWLWRLDPQGLRRKLGRDMGKALEIASKFVQERMEERQAECGKIKRDFLDVLLEYRENGNEETIKFSDEDLNIFILVIDFLN